MNDQEKFSKLLAGLVRVMAEEETATPGACAFGRHFFTLYRENCAFCSKCAKVVRLVIPPE
mgnify:CR=1 FL=1